MHDYTTEGGQMNNRKQAGRVAEDRTPDHVYIQVYPLRLRKIVQEHNLTRAQAYEFINLGMRIDENNLCYPSKRRSTNDVGMKNEKWTRDIHYKLKEKGVIEFVETSDNQSIMFRVPAEGLPRCFEYRASKKGGSKSSPQGGTKSSTYTDASRSEFYEMAPRRSSKQDSLDEKEKTSNKQVIAQSASPERTMRAPGSDAYADAMTQMVALGMNPVIADIIMREYRLGTVQKAIDDCSRLAEAGKIQNPAGWLVKTVRSRAGDFASGATAPMGHNRADSAPQTSNRADSAPQTSNRADSAPQTSNRADSAPQTQTAPQRVRDAWQFHARNPLSVQLNKNMFDHYVRALEVASYDDATHEVTFEAKSARVAEWCAQHIASTICQLLNKSGKFDGPVSVKFIYPKEDDHDA